MVPTIRIALVALFVSWLAGCIGKTYDPMPTSRPLREVRRVESPPHFESSGSGPVSLEDETRSSRFDAYSTHRLQFASSGNNGQLDNQVEGRYFRHREPGAKPLVVILPIWGRSTIPQQAVRRRLQNLAAAEPMHIVTITGENYLFDWDALASAQSGEDFLDQLAHYSRVLAAQVRDMRRLVDWASSRPEVDEDKIGLVGFSISAILGSTIMALDERVSRGAFVMGGGSLTDVFVFCHRDVARVRDNLRLRTRWDDDTMRDRIDGLLAPVSPLRYAAAIDPRQVLLVEAARDQCVPDYSREALWQAMGRPARITIDLGHRRSFYSMTFLDRYWTAKRIGNFFAPWPLTADDTPPERAAR